MINCVHPGFQGHELFLKRRIHNKLEWVKSFIARNGVKFMRMREVETQLLLFSLMGMGVQSIDIETQGVYTGNKQVEIIVQDVNDVLAVIRV